MRLAALYDVHGNLPALEAVLDAIRREGVEELVVGGDVFPGPMPVECLSRLRDWPGTVYYLHGNGDRETVARYRGRETEWYRTAPTAWREPIDWSAGQLTDEWADRIESWPPTLRRTLPGLGDVFFCHATPRNDTDVFTRRTAEARLQPVFQGVGAAVVVCGHTHIPFDRTVGPARVVNAGSVGMPIGKPGASWMVLGPGVEFRHTSYDDEQAAETVRRSAYPGVESFVRHSILSPPPEDAVLAGYARVELDPEPTAS